MQAQVTLDPKLAVPPRSLCLTWGGSPSLSLCPLWVDPPSSSFMFIGLSVEAPPPPDLQAPTQRPPQALPSGAVSSWDLNF